MYQKFIAKFNAISFTITLILCSLLPFFFLPGTWGGLGAVKGVLLYVGVFLAFSFWLLAQFVEGSLKIPRHKAVLALGAWVVLALVSALTSKNVTVSLWGRGFAVDSFATVLVLGMLTFLVATFAREQKRLVKLFLGAFSGSVLTVLLQVIFYVSQKIPFVAKYLAHVANQGTLVGTWVDFAHFVTFTFLLSLLMYEVLMPKGFFKFVSLFAMVLSIIVLVFLNFKVAWIVTIVSSLLVFVYKSSVERSVARFFPQQSFQEGEGAVSEPQQRFPVMSFAALLVGLFFFLSSGSIGANLARHAGIVFSDIRPSVSATTHIVRATLGHDPIFGAGAGRFADMWNLYHPLAINQTQFWNTSFDSGFSMLFSTLATNGILVTIAILAVFVLSILHGFRLFNYQFPDRFSRFIAVAALIMLIAFFILFALSSPGIVLIVFGFIYLGLLLGVSSLVGRTQVMSINYLRDPRLSFFAILILVLATMTGFTAAYFSGNRFASIVMYNHAITAADATKLQQRLDRAISLSPNDVYWRTRTALFVRKFTDTANAQSPDKAQLQSYFTQAEQSARAGVAWDTNSANNWLGLSQVYQLVSGGDNADAYTNAKQAADEAVARSPLNPVFLLNQAQLALTKKDAPTALDYIKQALALKADYLDAFVLRAQIRTAQGSTTAAKEELTAYTQVAPYDDQGYLLLGQANIAAKDYQSALSAYTRAAQLNPQSPNGELGVINTLITMGEKDQAVAELKKFKTTFPNVSGVDEKITELQKKAPVVDTTPTQPTKN